MTYIENVKLCKAECGEKINDFAKELVDYRKRINCDIIAKFNGVYIEVTEKTSVSDIIIYYHRSL